MSLSNHKITSYQKSIAALPDKVQNRAQELKELFDARTDEEVKAKHNALIDALEKITNGQSGADSIGFTPYIGKISAQDVQAAIEEAYDAIDQKIVDIGAGDMEKAVYDPHNKRAEYQPKTDNAFITADKTVTGAVNEVLDTASSAQSVAANAQATASAANTTATSLETRLDDAGIAIESARAITDLDTAMTNGWYRASSPANAPIAGACIVNTVTYNTNFSIQYWHPHTNETEVQTQFRTRYYGVWGDWRKIKPQITVSGGNGYINT